MLRLLFLLVVVGLIVAVKFLPWWVTLSGAVGLVITGRFAGGWFLKRLFMIPFKAKGAVLRNAKAEVHGVVRAAAPEQPVEVEDDDDTAAIESVKWPHYRVDVTITPEPKSAGGFQLWEPGELRLADIAAKPMSADDDDEVTNVVELEIEQDGAWQKDEGMKYGGPLRLRLLVAVKPGHTRLKLRYYFEDFGQVSLPA